MSSPAKFETQKMGRLKDEWERLGISGRQVAKICEVSSKTPTNWDENGTTPAHALEILARNGFDVMYIVTGVRSPQQSGAPSILLGLDENQKKDVMRKIDEYREGNGSEPDTAPEHRENGLEGLTNAQREIIGKQIERMRERNKLKDKAA